MSDVNILKGMNQIVNSDNVESNINLQDVEKQLIEGNTGIPQLDPNEKFSQEMSALSKALGIDFNVSDSKPQQNQQAPPETNSQQSSYGSSEYQSQYSTNYDTGENKETDYSSSYGSNYGSNYDSSSYGGSYGSNHDSNYDTNSSYGSNHDTNYDSNYSSSYGSNYGSNYDNSSNGSQSNYSSSGQNLNNHDYSKYSNYNSTTNYFQEKTMEQTKSDHISNVLSEFDGRDEMVLSIENEKREDMKSRMLEQIDMLRLSLEEDGIDVSRVDAVTPDDSYEKIESILKILRLKNDRNRYCSFAEEFIIFGAHTLEEIFNGERVFLGKYSPDLTGWHNTVNVKLRRMRYDTSTLVSNIMSDYNIGPGIRMALELIPSMFLHSRMRRDQFGSSSLYTDSEISDHMNSIRDFEDN